MVSGGKKAASDKAAVPGDGAPLLQVPSGSRERGRAWDTWMTVVEGSLSESSWQYSQEP